MRAALGMMDGVGEESPRREVHTVRVLSGWDGRIRSSKSTARDTEVGNGAWCGVPSAEGSSSELWARAVGEVLQWVMGDGCLQGVGA